MKLTARWFFVLWLLSYKLVAQPLGNEWINYNQKYWKFPIVEEGIYRINYNTLVQAGFPVNSISAKNIQLFNRGKEVPIYIEGEADGIFNNTDYIEFYAKGNDGYLDTLLYEANQKPTNPYVSLFNDTSFYYLTYNNNFTGNARIVSQNDNNLSGLNPINAYYKTVITSYKNYYHVGPRIIFGLGEPGYMEGEGYVSSIFGVGSVFNVPIKTNEIANGTSILSFGLITDAIGRNGLQVSLNSNLITDTNYFDFNLINRTYAIDASNLNQNNVLAFSSVQWPGSNSTGRMGVAYVSLTYPHLPNFEDSSYFRFTLPEQTQQTKTLLTFDRFNGTTSNTVFYDITGNFRVSIFNNGNQFSAIIPNIGSNHECVIINSGRIRNVNKIQLVNYGLPNAGFFTNYGSILSNIEFLIVSHPLLASAANDYALYRTSKGMSAYYVNIEELYDQYAHGIRKNPYAIRGLAKQLISSGAKAKYLLLLGKSIESQHCRLGGANFNGCLVPTWGNPGSDNLLTANLSSGTQTPALATGRIAAKTNQEAVDYLNKVIEFESNAPALWMKNILHFAGGTDATQNNELKNYLKVYEDTLEDFYFGGKVHLFSKTTNQPIQTNLPDSVKNLINNGVSLLTFFGHAAGSSFDVSIDYAANYNNQGKYPLIVANSCFAGDIHQPSSATTSEDWVLKANKGSIAFLAQVGTGVANYLHLYSSQFFRAISKTHYANGIGVCIQVAINANSNVQNSIMRSTNLEMTLHGDPAIVLNSFLKPDFVVSSSNIFTKPSYVDATVDSFDVYAVIHNIGMAYPNPVSVEFKRTLPSQSVTNVFTQIPKIYYADTIKYRFATNAFEAGGINKFCIDADPNNLVDELENFVNNKACYDVNINSDDVFPIYPYHYSVIPDNQTKLIASTSNPFAPVRNYRFQIDTTDLFNSPFLKETTLTKPGGLIEWSLNFPLTDSTVYFWRVATDDGTSVFRWKEFSFQYIPQKSGWGQSHFFQFKENNFKFLDYNRSQRKINYVNSIVRIECDVFGNSTSFGTGYKIDGNIIDYAGCGATPQIHIAVIDTLTFTAWATDRNNYGNNNAFLNGQSACGPRITPDRMFAFAPGNPTQLQAMRMFLDTAVPNGFYVLVYTYVHGDFSKWDNATLSYFNSLGSSVNAFMGNVPYIFFCKKGDLSSAKEVFASSPNSVLTFAENLTKNWDYGNMNSVLIGPSQKWNSFHWRSKSVETPSNDEVKAQLYGLKNPTDPVPQLLAEFPSDSLDVLNLERYISASVYPYLKLNFFTKDDITLSPRQLRYWRILHEDVPEAAVAPSIKFSLNNSTLNAGEELKLVVAVKNISQLDMDSLKIKYWLIDRFNQRIDLPVSMQGPLASIRQKPLIKQDTLYSSITIPTLPYQGVNQLWMEINPDNDQPEKYHFNNYLNLSFNVNPDRQNPLLDVTFDGVRIMDGDIVSANPNVVITLKDENKFLALADTSLFEIYLLEPDKNVPLPVYFAGGNNYKIEFTPAGLPANRAKINYNPQFTTDGVYELIVQGRDVSGNRSAGLDYKIRFEVITKSTITHVFNYPNPFSTKTHFAFTLTGSRIPTYFKIQILTVTGKVVREIDLSELGPIHIGKNITEYAWDGTDMFGDKLATGVYFYKVITNIDGEEIERRETAADQFFKKGFGKMYLMR